jgi:DNA mismatch repair ATPase MutL
VHNSSVGFSLKKLNDNGSDVRTSPNSTQEDNIRILYGHAVAKDLIKLNVEDPGLKVKGKFLHILLMKMMYNTDANLYSFISS